MLPSIKDDPPSLKLEGKCSEAQLPNLEDLDDGTNEILGPKMHFKEDAGPDSGRKYKEELRLLKEEQVQNIKDIQEQLSNTSSKLMMKEEVIKELEKAALSSDRKIQ